MIARLLPSASEARRDFWLRNYGSLEIELESPELVRAEAPGGVFKFYKGKVSALTETQRRQIILAVSQAFGLHPIEVEEDLMNPEQGLPILAADVEVITTPTLH